MSLADFKDGRDGGHLVISEWNDFSSESPCRSDASH